MIFSWKCILFNSVSTENLWKMSYLFSFSRYQKQWWTGRKREEDGITKIWITRERKELFIWNRKHFSKFLKGYRLVKKWKIANSRLHHYYSFIQTKQFIKDLKYKLNMINKTSYYSIRTSYYPIGYHAMPALPLPMKIVPIQNCIYSVVKYLITPL